MKPYWKNFEPSLDSCDIIYGQKYFNAHLYSLHLNNF